MEELLLVQVKELNDTTYIKLEAFGEVEIVSELMAVYGLKTDVQYLELIKNISEVINVGKNTKGFLLERVIS